LLLASVSHRQQVTSTPRQISIDTHTHDIRVTGITSKLVGNMPQKFQLAATTASQQKVKKRSKQQLKKNRDKFKYTHTHTNRKRRGRRRTSDHKGGPKKYTMNFYGEFSLF